MLIDMVGHFGGNTATEEISRTTNLRAPLALVSGRASQLAENGG